MHDISHDTPADSGPNAPASGDQLARQEAIKQIERRRRFWVSTAAWTVGHDLGGGRLGHFGVPQRGRLADERIQPELGIPNVWNYWIIYPFIAWVLGTAAGAWWVYGRKPVSESEIQREIERQAGRR